MDPHEDQQVVILKRIQTNVDKLLSATVHLSEALATVNAYNEKTVEVAELWRSYGRGVSFNLGREGVKGKGEGGVGEEVKKV
ncbi:hypothetical protein BT69DRAFT_1349376 [Atractiella rhizophila]|nr:hypothetical protein BT69DRAFT_1349376 [Atractiella rhizophila]